MLGRNSSTFSAVAVAAALGAPACEIFSEVPGVFTGDPDVIPEAHLITELSYAAAKWMGMSGAKIVPAAAIDLAVRHSIMLVCRTLTPAVTRGTVISQSGAAVAVVTGTRSRAWAFEDPEALDRAHRKLAATAQTQDVLLVDCDGTGHLVAPDGDPYGMVAQACAADGVLRPDLRLITTVRGPDHPSWALVPAATLAEQARRRHEAYYPSADSRERRGRSPLSSILLASKDVSEIGRPTQSSPAPNSRGSARRPSD
jgi:aspartate kinase